MYKYFLLFYSLLFSFSCLSQRSNLYQVIEAKPYGGWKVTRGYIKHEMVYPPTELENKAEGEVVLKFDILPTGSIQGMEVLISAGDALDKEAIRLAERIRWIPAIDYDGPVQSIQKMNFVFNIKRYNKWVKKRGYSSIQYPYRPVDKSNHIFEVKETTTPPRAMFEDSTQTIHWFLKNELSYPEEAFNRNIHGKVTLDFIVEEHGKISSIHPSKPLGGGCTEEAIRLIKLLKWYPAIYNGKAVRTNLTLDVIFVLPVIVPRSG